MKRFSLITLFIVIVCFANAQAPQKFNYQAIARNVSGQELTSQNISIRISILDLNPNGNVLYQETHSETTSPVGLFSLEIGGGTIVSGVFANINWGAGDKYIKTEIDPTGGTSYAAAGTSQLLSVPYALNALNSSTSNNGFSHYVGELYGGGVVFHVFRDAGGVEHGLIISLADLSTSYQWSNINSLQIGTNAESVWNGPANTSAIITQPGHTTSAAALCDNYAGGGFTDWYLPSIQELNMLWNNLYNVNRTLDSDGNPSSIIIAPQYYWSSTEISATVALGFNEYVGTTAGGDKDASPQYVRAVRAY
jgi:hypothetical protein